ncbi:MAG: DUF1553 domain-containing protein, partial [Acidobacteria bacterium]|nr:DUF1553 domain-containing protein [Acidobacteriota bacterium]
ASLPGEVRQDLKTLGETAEDKRSSVQKYLAEKFDAVLKITTEELARRFPEYRAEADRIRQQLAELRENMKPAPAVRALYEMGGEPSATYLLRRGDALAPGERVQPGVPLVLSSGFEPYRIAGPGDPSPAAGGSTGRRLALARWLVQPNHPLTARVIVNRVWMHHFGRGIVPSVSNFGRTGVAPTHPELLDWLATELVRQRWSLKAIHRLILTSAAWRQSSRGSPEAVQADPENLLLSRMPLRRLDADALYDSILKVTGRLDRKQFGPPAPIEVKPDGEVVAKGSQAGWRRAIYILQRRRSPLTMLEVFDTPPMSPNCVERPRSIVPTQALQLMNGRDLLEHARYLAGRVLDGGAADPRAQVERVYTHVLSRPPSEAELALAVNTLSELAQHWRAQGLSQREPEPQTWVSQWKALGDLIHTLLNSAEFAYVD